MIFKSPHSPVEIPEISLSSFVLRHVPRLQDKPAFIDGATGRSITYSQAADQVTRLAAALAQRGFSKGDVLAIYAPNLPEYPIAVHAAATAGGAVTTVNPMSSSEDLNHQLRATGAKFIFTASALLPKATAALEGTSVQTCFVLDKADGLTSLAELLEIKAAQPSISIDPREDVVALPFSSGTTGLPKGVMLTHYNMVANASQFSSLAVTTEDDVVLSVPPLFHIYGITVVINTIMANGSTVITMPQFDFELFLRLLQDYKVTQTYLVPPVAQLLAKHPLVDKFDLSSLKQIISGGAPLGADLSEACSSRLNCAVLQAYGMTEAGPVTHLGYREAARNRAGAIGHVYPNTDCRVIDVTTGADLGTGKQGEIWVRGPQVMKGYLNNREETDKILDKEGWLRTGDVGKVDKDGYLTVLDRIKELIKVKGFQVAPAEVEGVLLRHPAVAEAAVIPSPDDESGEVPVAYIVKKSEVSADELIDFVAEQVTSYKRVREIEFVESIPKTLSGKILRRELIEQQRKKVAERCANQRRLEERVTVEKRGAVLLIGLDRPHKSNAIDPKMILGLAKALTELDEDPQLRCAVLFAHGSAFSAGFDLSSTLPLMAQDEEIIPGGLVDPWGVTGGRERRKPLVVAVHGRCSSGGLELCLAADIVVSADDARFSIPETSLGLIPMGGAGLRLPAHSGWGNAMRYLLTGDEFSAAEAHRLGIVQEVCPANICLQKATEIAERIAARAPLAVEALLSSARQSFKSGFDNAARSLRPVVKELAGTSDCKEGIRSFMEKRTATFSRS